jgi:hypothetical protein
MLKKGSESDDSNSKNDFPAIWEIVRTALVTLLPILLRLAFARIGNNASVSQGEIRKDSKQADQDAVQYANNDLSPSARAQSRREPATSEV